MHFAPFHVEPSAAAAEKIEASCSAFHADTDYRRLLAIMFRSALMFHPGARLSVLTDASTPFASLPQEVSLYRSAVDPDRVMYSRLLAQIDYLRNHAEDAGVAFLDSDMIINGDLRPLMSDEFDVALTYRSDAEMPLNGGLILVRSGS